MRAPRAESLCDGLEEDALVVAPGNARARKEAAETECNRPRA
ncbi:hypothetical protein ABZ876_13255 [Streptomyces sp. NPDC046931]